MLLQTQFKAHPLLNTLGSLHCLWNSSPDELLQLPNKMNVPLVEEEDMYRHTIPTLMLVLLCHWRILYVLCPG